MRINVTLRWISKSKRALTDWITRSRILDRMGFLPLKEASEPEVSSKDENIASDCECGRKLEIDITRQTMEHRQKLPNVPNKGQLKSPGNCAS